MRTLNFQSFVARLKIVGISISSRWRNFSIGVLRVVGFDWALIAGRFEIAGRYLVIRLMACLFPLRKYHFSHNPFRERFEEV
jgi:hypothetical protein